MIKILKEDFKLNSFRSFIILFFYRLTHYAYDRNYTILVVILNFIFHAIKVLLSIQSQISYKAKIGSRIRLPHIGFGVVISAKAAIGNDVTIYHLVTIGINENKCHDDREECVFIGDNCYIGAGAKIISSKIGNHVMIGVNAIVYKDIPDKTTVLNQIKIK